ncbi:MAG TPA: EamA family transporter [Methylomirabilota bacterium]|nr:EamA family transporter [Methylomirabilota bacterium]
MTPLAPPGWLLLSLTSMALVGAADLLLRRATLRGVRPASFMVLQSWFFGSTALAWALATGSLRWSGGVLFGPLAGVLAFVATYAFLRSLQAPGAQVSVNAALYRLNLAVTAVLAVVVLGEAVTPAKVGGLLFAVAAVLLLTDGSAWRPTASAGGVGWASLAMAAFGLVFFLYKVGVGFGAPPPLLIFGQFCALTTISLGYAIWREGGLRFTPTIWAHAPACGVLNSSGRVLLAWALVSGDASAAVPVSQMSFVFTFLLAAPLFGEPVTPRKLGGLLAAVLAVLAFSR